MNNTDKLLRAFIEASGFEIEEVTTNRREVEEYKAHRDNIINSCLVGSVPIGNRPKPIYDYKVTKKGVDGYIEDIEDVIRILSNHDTMYKDSLERVIDFLKGL